MKKFLALALALIMVLSLFTACGQKEAATDAPAKEEAAAESSAPSRDDVIVRCEQVWYNLHPLEGIVGVQDNIHIPALGYC